MPDFPSCDRSFDSSRGLRVHHSSVHDSKLPNRVCAHCDIEFYCKHEKKYCSDECRDASVSFKGKRNPNYRGGKKPTQCELCGDSFRYYPSEKPGRFCGECVETESWRHERDIRGEQNPRWNGGKQTVQCDKCDTPIKRRPSRLRTEHVFCSDECQYGWVSEAFTGEGHPNWKGGTNTNYGRGWQRVRRQALERDNYECVRCGTTKAELGRNPDVHHIVPVRAFVETAVTAVFDAHYLENVISLCPSCHRKAEFGRIYSKKRSNNTPRRGPFLKQPP